MAAGDCFKAGSVLIRLASLCWHRPRSYLAGRIPLELAAKARWRGFDLNLHVSMSAGRALHHDSGVVNQLVTDCDIGQRGLCYTDPYDGAAKCRLSEYSIATNVCAAARRFMDDRDGRCGRPMRRLLYKLGDHLACLRYLKISFLLSWKVLHKIARYVGMVWGRIVCHRYHREKSQLTELNLRRRYPARNLVHLASPQPWGFL